MKPHIIFSRRMSSVILAAAWCASLVCPAALGQGILTGASDDLVPVVSDGQPLSYGNWVTVGFATPFVDGNRTHFMQRHRIPGSFYGGADNLHLERFVGEGGMISLDGRAIYENRDYRLRLAFEDQEMGFARAGFSTFRTWYDGSGGFFPREHQWFDPPVDRMGIDRGEAWLEAGITLPDLPRVSLRYSREMRRGQKPSLSWGDSDLGDGVGFRNIAPAYWQTDEIRNVFEGSVRHAFGGTRLQVGMRYERGDVNNARNVERRPEEPQSRFLTQHEGDRNNLFHVHATGETRLSSRVLFTTSYAFSALSGDLSGSRIYGSDYDPVYDPLFDRRQARDVGFIQLFGTSNVKQHTAGANLMASPWKHFTIVPSVRLEQRSTDGSVHFLETYVQTGQGLETSETPKTTSNQRDLLEASGSLDVRYTGVRNLLLYLRGNWLTGTGDLLERELQTATGTTTLDRQSDDSRYSDKYVAGMNWYPVRGLNVGVQAYHKRRITNFDHGESPRGLTRYPAYLTRQDYATSDINVRVRWRVMPGISLSSRVDLQATTFGAAATEIERIESANLTSRILSQSVTWVPSGRLFVLATLNHVSDRRRTPLNGDGEGTDQVVPRDRNDYLNATLASTLALAQHIDVEAQYFVYLAENFVDNSAVALPVGTGCEEHGFSGGIAWRVQPGLRWSVRYVYFTHRDQSAGWHSNYDTHLIQTGVQYRF